MCKTCGKYVLSARKLSKILKHKLLNLYTHAIFLIQHTPTQTIQPTHRICSPQSAHKALRAKATWKKNSRVSMGVRTKSDMPCSRYKVDLKAKEFGVRLHVRVLCQSYITSLTLLPPRSYRKKNTKNFIFFCSRSNIDVQGMWS